MSDEHGRDKTPLVEIGIAIVGACLLLAMVGYLVLDAWQTEAASPPDIVMESGAFGRQSAGWRVEVKVANRGDEPAEALELRAELTLDDGEVEEAALTIDYLPPHAEADAAFLFKKDPRGGELRLRAVGYLEP